MMREARLDCVCVYLVGTAIPLYDDVLGQARILSIVSLPSCVYNYLCISKNYPFLHKNCKFIALSIAESNHYRAPAALITEGE